MYPIQSGTEELKALTAPAIGAVLRSFRTQISMVPDRKARREKRLALNLRRDHDERFHRCR